MGRIGLGRSHTADGRQPKQRRKPAATFRVLGGAIVRRAAGRCHPATPHGLSHGRYDSDGSDGSDSSDNNSDGYDSAANDPRSESDAPGFKYVTTYLRKMMRR